MVMMEPGRPSVPLIYLRAVAMEVRKRARASPDESVASLIMRQQHKQRYNGVGTVAGPLLFPFLLMFYGLIVRPAESFLILTGQKLISSRTLALPPSNFLPRINVASPHTTTATAITTTTTTTTTTTGTSTTRRFDSERRMDIDLSFAKTTAVINGTGTPFPTETQLMFGLRGERSSSTLSSLSLFSSSSESLAADVPRPTENGGYTHTTKSKAKISAANKGKTPWNKGLGRSEEEKAKIAAGVRAKNRERFLKKLKDMGLTEIEYEDQKKAERRKKDSERHARKTANGGYTPTEETKQKISQILREKYAKGEITRRKMDPAKVRRGFEQSEETRKKISESLRKRWAKDEGYRKNMTQKASTANSNSTTRKRISETLQQKWKDPEFRAYMMENMAKRTGNHSSSLHQSRRDKISQAMKKRWQNEEYRLKVTDSIIKRAQEQGKAAKLRSKKPKRLTRETVTAKALTPLPATAKVPTDNNVGGNDSDKLNDSSQSLPATSEKLTSRTPRTSDPRKRSSGTKTSVSTEPLLVQPKKVRSIAEASFSKQSDEINAGSPHLDAPAHLVLAKNKTETANGATAPKSSKNVRASMAKAKNIKDDKHGSVSRLREERRDLYDLLYGDDDSGDDDDDGSSSPQFFVSRTMTKLTSVFDLDDENLDSFDPYGLDDF